MDSGVITHDKLFLIIYKIKLFSLFKLILASAGPRFPYYFGPLDQNYRATFGHSVTVLACLLTNLNCVDLELLGVFPIQT